MVYKYFLQPLYSEYLINKIEIYVSKSVYVYVKQVEKASHKYNY